MSAPLVWIIFPFGAALILYYFRWWRRSTTIAGMVIALGLWALAWQFPIGLVVRLGPWSLKLGDTLTILGRQLILRDTDRPILALIYLGAAFWFGGSIAARPGRMALSLGLAIVALLTAALAVDPFLYAALLIEMAVLVSVLVLSPPGKPIGRGVLRLLTFQTLGMPFILFTGWLLAGVEANPGDPALIGRVGFLMGLGFSFLLAIFPFHSWIPMLMEESHPYAVTFVILLLPEMITLFGLSFLDTHIWIRDLPMVYQALRWAGVLMVVAGGLWAVFQRHLGRMFGYAVIVGIGYALLALAAPGGLAVGLPLHFALLLPRALATGVWALALSILQRRVGDLSYHSVKGTAFKFPAAAAALVLAHLSIAGFPMLAGFPVTIALWGQFAKQEPWLMFCMILGSVGLLAGGLRTLAVLIMGVDESRWQLGESGDQILLLGIGTAGLLVMGLFPQWFIPVLSELPRAFEHLIP